MENKKEDNLKKITEEKAKKLNLNFIGFVFQKDNKITSKNHNIILLRKKISGFLCIDSKGKFYFVESHFKNLQDIFTKLMQNPK